MKPKQNRKQKTKDKPPVFTRIFAYTMLLLALMSLAAGAVFGRQFLVFYRTQSQRQLLMVFQSMFGQFEEKSPQEIADIARSFYEKNQSFRFIVKQGNGDILFSSPGAEEDGKFRVVLYSAGETAEAPGFPEPDIASLPPPQEIETPSRQLRRMTATTKIQGQGDSSYMLLVKSEAGDSLDYADLALKSCLALLIMIAIGALGAVLFALKITKPLEDELARERVMEENQRLFFSAASHELKTPIAATEALIEGMIANIGDYKDHPKYLRECLKNLDSQNHLVSEILELVKLSDEKAEPLMVPLDLAEACNVLIAEYRPLAEQRGLEIRAALPAGLSVRADRGLLYRVLSNVIANAVQNTPENGAIRITAEDEAAAWEPELRRGSRVRLSVLNTGAEIPGAFLPRLFDPFYRPDPARSRNHARSGLGLSIVKKSLDRMGIPFALENTAQGVLFWIDLETAPAL